MRLAFLLIGAELELTECRTETYDAATRSGFTLCQGTTVFLSRRGCRDLLAQSIQQSLPR